MYAFPFQTSGAQRAPATKRRGSEAARRQRARRMFSALRKAARHTDTLEQMIDEATRIVVKVAGYRLAWVGVGEFDPTRAVTVLGCAGPASPYVADVRITWANEPLGRGPAGVALREQRVCVNRDSRRNSSFAPWREAAARFGLGSSAAIPFRYPDGRPAALVIYASRPKAFDTRALALLREFTEELEAFLRVAATPVTVRRERQSIGFDLHDTVGQLLFGGRLIADKLHAEAGSSVESIKPQLAQLAWVFEEALDHVRRISAGDARTDANVPLRTRLDQLVASCQAVGVPCSLVLEDGTTEPSAALRRHLDLIAREAVVNAAKHGRAKRIEVRWGGGAAASWLTVADDGVGFVADTATRGLGLSSMEYRAKVIGATLQIDSAPGQGSRVTVRWPHRAGEHGG